MVLWCSVGDFNNREGSDSEDQPEHTLIAEPFLSCKQVYVTLATSPLLKKKMEKIWEKYGKNEKYRSIQTTECFTECL